MFPVFLNQTVWPEKSGLLSTYLLHVSCEENLPQFSKELVQQNLRKFGFGGLFWRKTCKVSIRVCIWSLYFSKGTVFLFGRVVWKVWHSKCLQAGSWLCKDTAEFGAGFCARSVVVEQGEERLLLLPSTTLFCGHKALQSHSNPPTALELWGESAWNLKPLVPTWLFTAGAAMGLLFVQHQWVSPQAFPGTLRHLWARLLPSCWLCTQRKR